jgi:hypothetical protein
MVGNLITKIIHEMNVTFMRCQKKIFLYDRDFIICNFKNITTIIAELTTGSGSGSGSGRASGRGG